MRLRSCSPHRPRRRELDALRSALESDDAITAATSSSDAGSGKPSLDIPQGAMGEAALAADRVIFLGDAVWDGAAAQRADVAFVGRTCGGTSEAELRAAGAVEVWRDPAQLRSRLDVSSLGSLVG